MTGADTSVPRQLIIDHTEQVRQLVRDVIDQAGGAPRIPREQTT